MTTVVACKLSLKKKKKKKKGCPVASTHTRVRFGASSTSLSIFGLHQICNSTLQTPTLAAIGPGHTYLTIKQVQFRPYGTILSKQDQVRSCFEAIRANYQQTGLAYSAPSAPCARFKLFLMMSSGTETIQYWAEDPLPKLEALAERPLQDVMLAAHPTMSATPILHAVFGEVPVEQAGAFGSQGRIAAQRLAMEGIAGLFKDSLYSIELIGDTKKEATSGAIFQLHFLEDAQSKAVRQTAADDGLASVDVNGRSFLIPIRTRPGRMPTSCCKIKVTNLPADFLRAGATRALLTSAGYFPEQVTIKEEFAGEHPLHFAVRFPAIRRSSVLIAIVTYPPGDQKLSQLPNFLMDGESKITITVQCNSTPLALRPAGPPSVASEPMSLDRQAPSVSSMDVDLHDRPGPPAVTTHRDTVLPTHRTPFVPAQGIARDHRPPHVNPSRHRPSSGNPHRVDPLAQPLDALTDVGGQVGRSGIGFPPPPPPRMPVPAARLVGRDSPTLDPPSATPMVERPGDPATEACSLWLQDNAPDISGPDREALLIKTVQTWPALWAETRENANATPAHIQAMKRTWTSQLGGSSTIFPPDQPRMTGPEMLALLQSTPSQSRQPSPISQPEWRTVERRRPIQPPGFTRDSPAQGTRLTQRPQRPQQPRRNAPRQCRGHGPNQYWNYGSPPQPTDCMPPASAARRRTQP